MVHHAIAGSIYYPIKIYRKSIRAEFCERDVYTELNISLVKQLIRFMLLKL